MTCNYLNFNTKVKNRWHLILDILHTTISWMIWQENSFSANFLQIYPKILKQNWNKQPIILIWKNKYLTINCFSFNQSKNSSVVSCIVIEIGALVLFSWPFYPLKLYFEETKIHSFLKQLCSFYEKKVLRMMSAWASLERFCERTLFS